MANINIEQIKNEIVRYGQKSAFDLEAAILSDKILLNQFAKPLSKVKGEYHIPYVLMGNVVQAFSDKWTAQGKVEFGKKLMKNYHMKVNFPINPYEIYGSWEEDLYHEDKKPNEMPISKYIVDLLAKKIISDLDEVSITGEYDHSQIGNASPDYTKTIDGLNKVVDRAVADNDNPVFTIPVDSSLAGNIVDRVTKFEKGLPDKGKVSTIFMSLEEFNDYVEARETPANQYINFNDPQRGKTKYGRDLVGVPGLKKGRLIAWFDGNLFRLYDRKDNPARIDDVQVQDYQVKIFSQWHLGYDFAVNEYLFVESQSGSKKRGLNNAEKNKLFYPNMKLEA
ncbi:hypothetical protein CAPN008_20540 [Capnocytophaga canis]|uniref:hypothetical protein n=1 Tax=Capnocytophaga canis TaxID=1848903 RepID=UPI001AC4F36C|nr:hypothetical protein [Capnocytophaga canis]GIM62004.1 hypothetical protein CAPN008_20540 [Capnocytophaga canis]